VLSVVFTVFLGQFKTDRQKERSVEQAADNSQQNGNLSNLSVLSMSEERDDRSGLEGGPGREGRESDRIGGLSTSIAET
jgi:hypothetical protein